MAIKLVGLEYGNGFDISPVEIASVKLIYRKLGQIWLRLGVVVDPDHTNGVKVDQVYYSRNPGIGRNWS